MRKLIVFCFLPLIASGEFLKIEMGFGGMECASCGEFIQGKLGKSAGVKSVTVDRAKGIVTMQLLPGNKVKMEAVRSLVQQSGFTPKDATVAAHVVPRMNAGVSSVDVEPNYNMRAYDPDQLMREYVGKKVDVEGVIRILQDKAGLEVLEVKRATLSKGPLPVQ